MEDTLDVKQNMYIEFASSELQKYIIKAQELENENLEILNENSQLKEDHGKLRDTIEQLEKKVKEVQDQNNMLNEKFKKCAKGRVLDTLKTNKPFINSSKTHIRNHSVTPIKHSMSKSLRRSQSLVKPYHVNKKIIPDNIIFMIEKLIDILSKKFNVKKSGQVTSDKIITTILELIRYLKELNPIQEASLPNCSQFNITTRCDKSTLETQLLQLLTEYKTELEQLRKRCETLDFDNNYLLFKNKELMKYYMSSMLKQTEKIPSKRIAEFINITYSDNELGYDVLEKFGFNNN